MLQKPQNFLPDTWIKIFIGIGIFGFVVAIFLPGMMQRQFLNERERFDACRDNKRTDCTPSFVWNLFD